MREQIATNATVSETGEGSAASEAQLTTKTPEVKANTKKRGRPAKSDDGPTPKKARTSKPKKVQKEAEAKGKDESESMALQESASSEELA